LITILQENSFGALKLIFSYEEKSGLELLKIEGDSFRHLFLSRRSGADEKFLFRNLREPFLYEYEVLEIGKKDATLRLVSSFEDDVCEIKSCDIAWCVVDPKTIEKSLPMLNEIGVKNLYFIYSARSQKNFKIEMERINRILINSCCQCGRSDLMNVEIFKSLQEFCDKQKEFFVFDFGGETLEGIREGVFLVGPEGGFSDDEKKLLKAKAKKIVSFGTKNILRSETAVVAAASLSII
jgi:16S rRNA (uracil1498-N3)-methyltransferase